MTQLRILWHSNSPLVATGYGAQTRYAVQSLRELADSGQIDLEIGLSAFYGLDGTGPVVINGQQMYGNRFHGDTWGSRSVEYWYKHFEANLLITLMDAWVFDARVGERVRWVPWYPVDHDPIPPRVFQNLRTSWRQIAMSKFGQAKTHEVDLPAAYVPHCVPSEVFRPPSAAERRAAREWMGFDDDRFVFGTVAANAGSPARKGFPELFEAMQMLLVSHPKALLYVHTDAHPRASSGLDLANHAVMFALDDGPDVLFPDPYALDTMFQSDEEMRQMYWALDAFILPSYGEGFGVPIIEAQACGVPVIVHDVTAMSEHVEGQDVGLLIERGHREFTVQDSYWFRPRPRDILERMEEMIELSSVERGYLKAGGRQRVLERYDREVVRDAHWLPLLTEYADAIAVPDSEAAG